MLGVGSCDGVAVDVRPVETVWVGVLVDEAVTEEVIV